MWVVWGKWGLLVSPHQRLEWGAGGGSIYPCHGRDLTPRTFFLFSFVFSCGNRRGKGLSLTDVNASVFRTELVLALIGSHRGCLRVCVFTASHYVGVFVLLMFFIITFEKYFCCDFLQHIVRANHLVLKRVSSFPSVLLLTCSLVPGALSPYWKCTPSYVLSLLLPP
ncbi:unnamed protein product, partial [Discosporangium mesarthrocarpum]